jgi:hypothetical protein
MRDTRKDEGYFKGFLEDIQSDIRKDWEKWIASNP